MSTTTDHQNAPDHTTPTELASLTEPVRDAGLVGGDSEPAAPVPEASEVTGKPLTTWTGHDHETYLGIRPHGGLYNPAAEYSDPDWREPEPDTEAAPRTAHLAATPRDPETEARRERVAALSRPGPDSLEVDLWEADQELHPVGRFHDPDEFAEARARRDQLAAQVNAHEQDRPGPGDRTGPGGPLRWSLDAEYHHAEPSRVIRHEGQPYLEYDRPQHPRAHSHGSLQGVPFELAREEPSCTRLEDEFDEDEFEEEL